MITAKILKDSITEQGDRVTTFELEYPRYILAELNTHRVFSRNTASSRAIPYDKMIQSILDTNNMPMWTANKAGMQGDLITDKELLTECNSLWYEARQRAIYFARKLYQLGVHKQNFNRLLEPFQTVKTILTATEFYNFFKLRIHKDAMPEIRVLANEMKKAMDESKPDLLLEDDWHLPYITIEDLKNYSLDTCKKISVSCCAQVSYRKLDTTLEKALSIYDKLVSGDIIHGSAFEHICRPLNKGEKQVGNLIGFRQFRHDIEGVY